MRTQLVAEFEPSDRKFRFLELTRSLLVRHPDRDDFDGCWMSTIGRGPIAPGYSGQTVIEDLTRPVRMAPEDRFIIWYGDEVGRGVVLEPMFKAPMGPTADEVRRWADSGSLWPEQDWDLCIWSDDALLDTFLDVGAVVMNSPGLTVLAFGLESCVVYGGYGEAADGLTVMGFSEDRIPIDCPDATSNDHRIFSYLASEPALALEGNQITLVNEMGSITFTER